MELTSVPISATQRSKLLSAGYTSLSSLASVSSSDLAREIDVSESEATEILKIVSAPRTSLIAGAVSAWDKHRVESSCPSITTCSTDLDNILGGGIACKQVTEFGGEPGIGKTQLGIQLAINVQIPVSYDGPGGKAIYIDTEGSFMVERVLQIAEACIQDIPEHYRFRHKDSPRCKVEMLPGNMLENIFYFRVCSYTEQIAVINYLDKFVSEHRDVKIVVIDSITFHFRQDFDDLALRTRVLSGMALKLMNLAKKLNIAVVVLNQVTTKFAEGSFQLTLALGDSWSHSSTNRVILYWNGDERFAYLDKSPSCRSASTAYSVTSRGIRNSTSSYKRPKMM